MSHCCLQPLALDPKPTHPNSQISEIFITFWRMEHLKVTSLSVVTFERSQVCLFCCSVLKSVSSLDEFLGGTRDSSRTDVKDQSWGVEFVHPHGEGTSTHAHRDTAVVVLWILAVPTEAICYFQKLCDMNNLHAVMAVVSALQSAPIFRLTKTWAVSVFTYCEHGLVDQDDLSDWRQ